MPKVGHRHMRRSVGSQAPNRITSYNATGELRVIDKRCGVIGESSRKRLFIFPYSCGNCILMKAIGRAEYALAQRGRRYTLR
jgi:hypothetical protein